MTCTHLMYSNFIPASALLSQTTVLNIVSKCLDTQILFVGFPIPLHLPLTCFWTAGCHLFHADWWQQGEHQEHGKRLPTPLVPTSTVWELPKGSAGRNNRNSKNLLHPKNTGCVLLSVNFGTENTARIPKEQGAHMESLQMEYLAKNTCQAPEFYNLVNSWGFFQKDNSHTPLPCCCIFPQTSALTDELLGHVLKHTMTETTHRSYLTRAKIPCYEQHGHDTQRWINLVFAWTAMSLHHLKVHRKVLDILIYKEVLKAPGRVDLLSYRILQLGV